MHFCEYDNKELYYIVHKHLFIVRWLRNVKGPPTECHFYYSSINQKYIQFLLMQNVIELSRPFHYIYTFAYF